MNDATAYSITGNDNKDNNNKKKTTNDGHKIYPDSIINRKSEISEAFAQNEELIEFVQRRPQLN